MEDTWLPVDETGAYLGVKRDTVYKRISEKAMPSHKIGRLWKFKKDEIDRWFVAGVLKTREIKKNQTFKKSGQLKWRMKNNQDTVKDSKNAS